MKNQKKLIDVCGNCGEVINGNCNKCNPRKKEYKHARDYWKAHKEAKKKENKVRIIFGVLMSILIGVGVFVLILLCNSYVYHHNDWWTEIFCFEKGGEHQERLLWDVCVIEGVEYVEDLNQQMNIMI